MSNNYKGATRDPLMVLLLSIVTCGLYGWYWIWVTTDEINKSLGEERMNAVLLLIITLVTCGLGGIYWLYLIDKSLVDLGQRNQIAFNSSFVMWLVLCFIGGIGWYLAMFQTQTFLNSLWQKRA